MTLNASKIVNNTGKRPAALEPGTYPGRLVNVIDLGLQAQRPFQGKEKPPAYSIMLTYELTDEFLADEEGNELKDKPRHFSEDMPIYGLSADKATSTKRYKVFDLANKYGGDFAQCVGAPVLITLVKNVLKDGREFNNIAGVAAMREKDAVKLPPLVNKPKVFDLSAPDLDMFLSLPRFVQERIKENLEFKGSVLESLLKKAPATTNEPPKKETVVEDEDAPF